MTIFILILMALLLVVALERNNRRQPPHPPGLNGLHDRDDRDWARTQHDLVALGDLSTWSTTQQLGPRIF